MKPLFEDNGFLLLNSEKGNLLCEFVLKNGFCSGVTTSRHYHFHSTYEIHIPVFGNLHIMVDDKDLILKPGSVCIIPPNTIHYIFANENSFRIGYRFNFSKLSEGGEDCFGLFSAAFGQMQGVGVVEDCEVYEKYLSAAVSNLLTYKPEFMTAELLMLATCDIALSVASTSGGAKNGNITPSLTLISESIEDFFNENYNRDVTLSELAKALNFSARHTERVLQKIFNMSFNELLSRRRLLTGKFLLRTTDLSLGEISEQIGFRDAGYFSRKFSTIFNITPAKYREKYKVAN